MSDHAALDDLAKAVDDRVRPADDADAVDGVPARYVAAPSSTEETAELLRAAGQHRLTVVARGSGTKQHWGTPPRALDLVVDTTAMSGVVEHAAGDLITVVQAGTALSDLQAVLARADQQLALDAPFPSATVGGTVATGTSGPRRVLYGTMRDLLIGVTFVRADGVVAKAGGKVVKNVAGYDFGKLLTGSYGTLGVVTEVALRLHPLPKTQRFVSIETTDREGAAEAARRVLGAQVVPSAVEIDQPAGGPVTVTVLVEGIEAGSRARAEVTQQLLGPQSALGPAPAWFGSYPFADGDIGLKITSTLSGVAPLLSVAHGLGERHRVPLRVRGSAAGVLYAAIPGDTPPEDAAHLVEEIRSLAGTYDGGVVVLTAPEPARDALDVWGPVAGLRLMRRLKDELDPDHRLAPGRFVGGI